MAWAISADVEEFTEAVSAFRNRVPITRELAAKVNGFSHQRGFTLAGVAQLDVVQQVHASIAEAIRKGTAFEEWKKSIEGALTTAWGKKDSFRIETIFRNATMQAYNAGRREQMLEPDVVRFRPYWLFDGIADQRQSEICRVCDGTLLRFDDPWWNDHTPPLHHRCRSSIRNIRVADANERGVTGAPEIEAQGGFGLTPEAEPWEPDLSEYSPELVESYEQKSDELEQSDESATLEPTPLLQANAGQFFDALSLTDGGARAREMLRDQIRQLLPEAVRRNNGSPYSSILKADKRINAYGTYETEGWAHPGLVRVQPDRVDGAKRVAAAFKAGRSPDREDMNRLGTLVHEELHGHSRLTYSSYSDSVGRALEEIGTELNARYVLMRLHPDFDPFDGLAGAKDLVGRTSYDDEIEWLAEEVALRADVTKNEALELMRQAHYRSNLAVPGPWRDAADTVDSFVRELDVPEAARQTIRERLPKLFP